jgi:hypothetical protein
MSISPERKLWQEVIYQAFIDATSESDTKEWRCARPEADAWIRGCGRNFRQVCAMAGMDPDFLSESYIAGRVNPDLLRNGDTEKARKRKTA